MTKQPGDTICLGDTVGHSQEPSVRFARVVGLRKDNCKPIESIILRKYATHGEPYPTGDYCTTWLVVLWTGTP